jgi:hypothetical protein
LPLLSASRTQLVAAGPCKPANGVVGEITRLAATLTVSSDCHSAARGAVTETEDMSVRTVVVAVAANLLVAVAKGSPRH